MDYLPLNMYTIWNLGARIPSQLHHKLLDSYLMNSEHIHFINVFLQYFQRPEGRNLIFELKIETEMGDHESAT